MTKTPSEMAAEEAVAWSARKRLGLMSGSDQDRFQAWLDRPESARAWQDVEQRLDELAVYAAEPEVRWIRDAALANSPPARRRMGWPIVTLAAAALALAIGLPILLRPSLLTGSTQAPAATRYATSVGARRDIRLIDGSIVSLDTDSIVEAAFTSERRDLRLLQGQAYFRVAKDPRRPFRVAAGRQEIIATGTQFDVRLDPGLFSVVLVEGHVRVSTLRNGVAPVVRGLQPGQALVADSAGQRIVAVDKGSATSWLQGQVVFRDEPIGAAVAEMNRYRTTALVVEDPRVAQLRVSGVFDTRHPENFLAAVTALYPIDAQVRSPASIVLVWKGKT